MKKYIPNEDLENINKEVTQNELNDKKEKKERSIISNISTNEIANVMSYFFNNLFFI